MATINATNFKALINDSEISDASTESVLDQSINLLNLFGDDLQISNLNGSSGSKSLTADSKTEGAIYFVARVVYASFYKNPTGASVGASNLTVSQSDLMSNKTVIDAVKEAAHKLKESDWSRAII